MKRMFLPAAAFFCLAALCVNISLAVEAATSSEFADAWNGGTSPITIAGATIAEVGLPGIVMENSLNAFSGKTMAVSGANGKAGYEAGSNALRLGSSTLAFAPGWDYGLDAAVRNLAIYGATNGAVSYMGNGTGAHTLAVDDVFFYGNAGTIGGGVNVQTQMQSNAANQYVLTDNYFIANTAASGGAVAMATNNSIFTSGANTFSVISTGSGLGDTTDMRLIALNKATAGNGGGLYFMGNNALGVRNEFTALNNEYYQNSATGLGGAIYNGVLNGNGPSANNFTITGGDFIENQAQSGGAVATTINGGSTNVKAALDGLFAYNIATGNGGAIYNAVGDQFSPFGGTVNFTITGPFVANRATNGGAIYNDLRPGQASVTVNIPATSSNPLSPTLFAYNTASGKGGAIYNTAGNNNPGTAVVNVGDGVIFAGNTANYGGAIYNDGNGVINLNTKSSVLGIVFTDNSASGAANGADIYQASATAVINITGDGINSVDDREAVRVNGGIAGVGTINQGMTGSALLILGEKSQSFDFKGVYNLANASRLDAYGLMFGGTNNINGVANIHSGLNSVYFNANMGFNSVLNYYSNSTERTSIGAATSDSAPGIQFKDTIATVRFTREGFDRSTPDYTMPRALYTLTGKIDNGRDNTVEFHHGDVAFGSTDFTGATNYKFLNNSVINLAGPLDPYQQYTFGRLSTNSDSPLADASSLLSLRVGNNLGSLQSDTINVLSGDGGVVDLGRVYINDAGGALIGRSQVIYGNALDFENARSQYVTTSLGTYQVTTEDDHYIQFIVTNRAAGNTTTTNNGGGSSTSTTDHTGTGGGATITDTATDGSAVIEHNDSGGNTTTVTINTVGAVTIEDKDGNIITVSDGDSKTISTSDGNVTIDFSDNGSTTTTTVKTPDGSGGSSTTIVTTDTGGGGSIVENPDGSRTNTAAGTVTIPSATLLVLNDVNELTGDATTAGMSAADPRGFQIGKDETYKNDDNLEPMADGTFSVHGEVQGTRTSTLSGIKESDGTTKQSLFDIRDNGTPAITRFNLQDLTVQDAYSDARGGSVLSMNDADSTATLNNLLVQRNETADNDGGAVLNQAGTILSTNVDYSNNKATGTANGGAIANTGTGITSVRGGSFTENTTDGDGGAIYNTSTNEMTIASGVGLTFTGNTATGDGGAIYNGAGGTLTLIADSYATADPNDGSIVFSGNTAGGTANDIHNEGDLVFTGSGGSITLNGGVTGPGTGAIRKEGESTLILGRDADNSRFTGAVLITKGEVDANGKFFGGTSDVKGGILDWNPGATKEDTAILQITEGGMVNVYGTLRLANREDLIAPEAATNLYGNIDLVGGAVYLSTQDQMQTPDGAVGTVNQSDGYLIIRGTGMVAPPGSIWQTGGVTRIDQEATVVLDGAIPNSGLAGGDIIIANATLSTNGYTFTNYGPGILGAGSVVPTTGSLAMGDDALMHSADGVVQTHTFAGQFGVISERGLPEAKFSVDLDAQAAQSDMFVFNGGTTTTGTFINGHPRWPSPAVGPYDPVLPDVTATTGVVVLSGLNLINSPATESVRFTIMSATGGISPGITFAAGMDQVDTPIGLYSLSSLGEATYELNFLSFHPRAYRAQAGTLAAVSGQSHFTNMLFDHVHLDSFDRADDGRPVPWQYFREGRGLWAKPYFFRENLPFGGDIGDTDSDEYGVIIGMDFPSLSLDGGAQFLPTVFAAYNGGRQDFADVVTTRDGGQAGFMGTFSFGRFAASVMGYAGGYGSEMSVAGYRDKPNNWFAGASAKAAYTVHAGDNLLFQPYALASFTAYGDQSWHSDYGSIRMEAGGYRGWNLAPGLAAAYTGDGWSVHASAHYMFSLNNRVTGGVGELELRDADTGRGYLEYGLGASRRVSESLQFEGKATFRSGSGVKSYGGHVGFSWQF